MKPYVVKQGDFLARLAYVHGFDADDVWANPKNQELKDTRDPNVLMPGDLLFIPDKRVQPSKPLGNGSTNAYTAAIPTVTMSLYLKSPDGAPLAAEPYEVHGVGDIIENVTQGDGLLELEVPVTIRVFQVTLPQQERSFDVHVGHLCPTDQESGTAGQLASLGYLDMPPHAGVGQIRDDFHAAVAMFQEDNDLAVTGEVDSGTRDAIDSAYRG